LQAGASVALQRNTTGLPSSTAGTAALSVTDGAPTAVTVTVRVTVPPGPSQAKTNRWGPTVNAAEVRLPERAAVPSSEPVQAPLATQRVTPVVSQLRRAVRPAPTVEAAADSVSVGAIG
jgi:hypothetical protein